MAKTSAGIVMHRWRDGALEVLLVHPGGPFWAKRDAGAWSIPKGEYGDDDDAQACALRELQEELGVAVTLGELIDLGSVRQRSGKVVRAWTAEGDFDPADLRSNEFVMEWPPRSGRQQAFPEVDRAAWLTPEAARGKLVPAQVAFIDRLMAQLAGERG